jgi:nucleoside-diphosphate-sugar epimerase
VSRLPARDLGEIAERDGESWPALHGAHVVVTGAAGFVGAWVAEALAFIADEFDLDIHITAVVRDAGAFRERLPHLAVSSRIRLLEGDVRRLTLPDRPTHIVHAASATTPARHAMDPGDIIDTIVAGTGRVAALARESGARLLLVSSGSVYDRRSTSSARIAEDHSAAEEGPSLAERFGVAKRRAERIATDGSPNASTARIFTVIGPRLPLGSQFAIGQFLGDALERRDVRVTGDGTPVRTYLYAADVTSWCLAILLRGRAGRSYNVGAEREHTMMDVADRVARLPSPRVQVTRALSPSAAHVDRYVPDTSRARDELGLDAWTGFDEALSRTWTWLRAERS